MELTQPQVASRFWDLMQTERFSIPAFWDYTVWDEFMYHIMCLDQVRLGAFRAAIGRAVGGKTVVEVGTGDRAPLAILCAEAGARKVYAIEANEAAAAAAARLVRDLGLAGRIQVIPGSSMSAELPERADVCLSEIIGCVGSSEGAVPILRCARRFLRDGGRMIPHRCVTFIAPLWLPDEVYHDDLVERVVEHYTERVRQVTGRSVRFTRFEYYNFPASHLIAAPGVFEDIGFNARLEESGTTTAHFDIASECRFDGFLLWLHLHVDEEAVIDTFSRSVWGAIYMPGEPQRLSAGDCLDIRSTVRVSGNGINPDYGIECTVRRRGQQPHTFYIDSRH